MNPKKKDKPLTTKGIILILFGGFSVGIGLKSYPFFSGVLLLLLLSGMGMYHRESKKKKEKIFMVGFVSCFGAALSALMAVVFFGVVSNRLLSAIYVFVFSSIILALNMYDLIKDDKDE